MVESIERRLKRIEVRLADLEAAVWGRAAEEPEPPATEPPESHTNTRLALTSHTWSNAPAGTGSIMLPDAPGRNRHGVPRRC